MRRKCRLHLVEVSGPLQQQQQDALGKFRRRVNWHDSLKSVLESLPAGAHPIIYSNEFFDAFPVRIFRRTADGFEELMVEGQESGLGESWEGPVVLPPTQLDPNQFAEGHRFEVAASIRQWMQENLTQLERGSLLTIDYGGSQAEIYHRRPHGTVRGYFFHNVQTGPAVYENPGRQDLTADVHFDDLEAWGAEVGVITIARETQGSFLSLFSEDSSEAADFLRSSAGEAFKVLIQRKE